MLAALVLLALASGDDTAPSIDVWYGARQSFGRIGQPQRWVNVLGNASDADGLATLSFSLNGGPEEPLTIGPDGRRLIAAGDFNVEIDRERLSAGENSVRVTAVDRRGERSSKNVIVEYVETTTWPEDYAVDWSEVELLEDAVQVVDGRWILEADGLRTHPAHVGYDRLVAIGDVSWRDYEVTLPITIHTVDTSAFESEISFAPAIAIDLRWLGHTDEPVQCAQPRCGWLPGGASNLFTWKRDGPGELYIFADPIHYAWPKSARCDDVSFDVGIKTWLKTRVETTPIGSLYSLKLWPDDSPEPAEWTLQRMTTPANLARGSFLLKAHHVDATFGELQVTALASVVSLAGIDWARMTKLTSVAVRSPLILVALAALLIAFVRRRELGGTAYRIWFAAVILCVAAALDCWLELALPNALQESGWNVRELTMASRVGEGARSLLVAIGFAVLFVGLLGRRNSSSSEAG